MEEVPTFKVGDTVVTISRNNNGERIPVKAIIVGARNGRYNLYGKFKTKTGILQYQKTTDEKGISKDADNIRMLINQEELIDDLADVLASCQKVTTEKYFSYAASEDLELIKEVEELSRKIKGRLL